MKKQKIKRIRVEHPKDLNSVFVKSDFSVNKLTMEWLKKARAFDILAKYLKIEVDYTDVNGYCECFDYLDFNDLEDITKEDCDFVKEVLNG